MFATLLSLLFPPSDNERILHSVHTLLPEPLVASYDSQNTVLSCARYDTPEIKAAILLNKNNGNRRAAVLLASLLEDVLLEELADELVWNNRRILICPIPLSQKQQRRRGFNQVARVLELTQHSVLHYTALDVLRKTKETYAQKSLDRETRLQNVVDTFAVSSNYSLHNTHVVVVDDVVTTGATLVEAARALTHAGAQNVTLVALSRA